jgi:hypothetical protein
VIHVKFVAVVLKDDPRLAFIIWRMWFPKKVVVSPFPDGKFGASMSVFVSILG